MERIKNKLRDYESRAFGELRSYLNNKSAKLQYYAKKLWSERVTVTAASTAIVDLTLLNDEYITDIIVWGTTDDYKVLFRGSEELWSGAHDAYGAMPLGFQVPIKFYKGDVLKVYTDVDSGIHGCSIYVLVTKQELVL